MPRKRLPGRIDVIADSATQIFIRQGFGLAKIAAIASSAKVGPGTIYLYAEGKEALYDLAIRRALHDPTVWDIALPHPTPGPGAIAEHVWRCLQNASHFPRLWLAADSPPPGSSQIAAEVDGILSELYEWLLRYRWAIKLIERSTNDWPDVAQVFYRRFWRGGIRRVADYLARRMEEGMIPQRDDPLVAAHLVVESLAWAAVHRYWTEAGATLPDEATPATVHPMLHAALLGNP